MRILVKNSKIRYTLLANMISVFGDYLFLIALLTYASTLVDSTLAISVHTFIFTIPFLFGVVFGLLADRTRKVVKILMCTNVVNLVIFIVIGTIFTFETSITNLIKSHFDVVDPRFSIYIVILVLLLIVQFISTYENGVSTRLFVKIVEKDDLAEARGLISGVMSTIKIIAKFSASILLVLISYANIAYINSLTYLIVIIIYVVFYFKNREAILKIEEEHTNMIATQKEKDKGLSL